MKVKSWVWTPVTVLLVVVMKLDVAFDFIEVLLIVDGGSDHFARIGDWAQKLHPIHGNRLGGRSYGASALENFVKIGN